ncbi:AraC family transcriptional regulator [Rhizobium sp. S152]|uniref:helix-turn-helix domain-containing protein n=1 Tax=Rhizobium sp. S152 TaxID=3055038 RepID=UPI0025A977DF|nr:AraC family transcriptional regulator [Rhizobium sp. S152]MDM9627537.1 AraC family transcriptional regulator [Rhizobium sp. S152]
MPASAAALSHHDTLVDFRELTIEASTEISRLVMHAISLVESDELIAIDLMKKASILLRPSASSEPETRRRSSTGGLAPWQVNRVKKYIEENLSLAISLDELAQLIRLSTSYFSAAFKVSFDMSPHNYIVSRRVEHAKRRMANSRDSLSEIALDCGLSDQAHLSRIFRRATGTTPSAWRRFSVSQDVALRT